MLEVWDRRMDRVVWRRHGGGGKVFSAERDRNTMRPLLIMGPWGEPSWFSRFGTRLSATCGPLSVFGRDQGVAS